MPIYLIRHGETALNAARILQPTDTPLSAAGLEQAQALALRMSAVRLNAIMSSDLPRAFQTAQAVMSKQRNVNQSSIHINPLLQERDLGDYRGKPYDAVGKDILTLQEAPPGGESMPEFAARVALAFSAMVQLQARYEHLAVVTHGLVIREMIVQHLSLRAGIEAPRHIGNTSVTVFETTPPYWVDVLNSTGHMLLPI